MTGHEAKELCLALETSLDVDEVVGDTGVVVHNVV